jgi:hypothetical protein
MGSKVPEDFLIAEFETAWAHLRAIDDRRFSVVQFFVGLNAAILAVAGALTSWGVARHGDWVLPLAAWIAAAAVSLIARALWVILLSERAATVRYRNKVNLLREILTDEWRSREPTSRYFTEGDATGIRFFEGTRLGRVGGTLEGVRALMVTVCVIWFAAALVSSLLVSLIR